MSRDETLWGLLGIRHNELFLFVQKAIVQGGIHPRESASARDAALALVDVIRPYPNGSVRAEWWTTEAGEKCSFFFTWVWGAESISVGAFIDLMGAVASTRGLKLTMASRRLLVSKCLREGLVFAYALPESFEHRKKGILAIRSRLYVRAAEARAAALALVEKVAESRSTG